MMHVYLTEEKIEQALKARAITQREAKELTAKMNRNLRTGKHRASKRKLVS